MFSLSIFKLLSKPGLFPVRNSKFLTKDFYLPVTFQSFSSFQHSRQAQEFVLKGLQQIEKGNFDSALEHFISSNEIIKQTMGEGHPSIIMNYSQIGSIYFYKKDYQQAVENLTKALELAKKSYSDEHPVVLGVRKTLALAYEESGNYQEAIACHEKVLDFEIKNRDFDPLSVCKTYNKIGVTYTKGGDYLSALKYFEKALEIEKQFWHTKDRCLGLTFTNMGALFEKKGENEQALKYYNEGLQLKLKAMGEKDLVTASIFQSIGDLLAKMNRTKEALFCLLKVHDIESKLLPRDSPQIAITCEKIGAVAEKENPQEALKYINMAIEIRNNKKEENQKELKKLYEKAAQLNMETGDKEESKRCSEQAKKL